MDFGPLIEKARQRFAELDVEVVGGELFSDPKRAREVMREHSRMKRLIEDERTLDKAREELASSREMAAGTDELAELAASEIPELESLIHSCELRVRAALLPPDGNEDRDAIVEIRAGTGGDEAAIFCGDLYRMYTRYVELQGLKMEPMESSPSEAGGFREIIFRVIGEGVFHRLQHESGVHRVQRVPATEAQGRIHTSTATVAVLPEAEEVDLEIRPEDLRIEVCRAGGPGGQGVNTTDSAVQVLHIPTGKIVRCQDGRSQLKNKEKAIKILRARLLEAKQSEEAEKYSATRRNQIGSGGREEKIRTYNYPQNRITDHRIGLTLHNLDRFMEGELDEMISALQAWNLQERVDALMKGALT